jgi:hypothetical protein
MGTDFMRMRNGLAKLKIGDKDVEEGAMEKHVWKQKAECRCCLGTGLAYGNIRDVGSVCSCYGGSGCEIIEVQWKDFKGRRRLSNIKRVTRDIPGIDFVKMSRLFEEETLAAIGGMSYEDWFNDKPFPPNSEPRRFCCPQDWYHHVNESLAPNWEECRKSRVAWTSNDYCEYYHCKEKCWERFDKEQAEKEKIMNTGP